MNQVDQLAANLAKIAEQARIAGERVVRVENHLNDLRDMYFNADDERMKASQQRDKLAGLMQEAIDNCETCRGETDIRRRCARCQTFTEALSEINNQAQESEASS